MKQWEIRVNGVCKTYGDLQVLKNCTVTLEAGGIYCLMAPSGAGKTTLLRLLMGLEAPDKGEILFVYKDQGETDTQKVRERTCRPGQMTFACVFQEDRLCPGLGIEKNIQIIRPELTGAGLREEILKLLPEDALRKPVSEFSGGMKRRAALLRALFSKGGVLILDEPFTGLDEESREAAFRLLREHRQGRTMLFTSHHREEGEELNATFLSLQGGNQS